MLPIIDTHRHLGGSITPSCVWQIIQKQGYKHLAESYDDVEKAMTFVPHEPRDFHRFLDKFKILDQIVWTEELINFSIQSVCQELENEGNHYCWMDFSINKYMHIGWHKYEAIKFIHNCFESYRPGKVGLILSLKYESLRTTQQQYAKLIEDSSVADILFGLDLVGDEAYFDWQFYAPIFSEWRKAGKMVRAHVGESQSADNVMRAIDKLYVTNIAHGIKIHDNKEMLAIARDTGITFDAAVTSNYLTGVWSDSTQHPIIDMMDAGLRVTIGSDDPVQCSTNLNHEYTLINGLGLSNEKCLAMKAFSYENTLKFKPDFTWQN